MGLPPKLLRRGITDMIRISDARMSGTAYGTVILHVSPEAALGGPLALVQNGDMIDVDIPNRRLSFDVAEEALDARRKRLPTFTSNIRGGYAELYVNHVMQADTGADFDFLVGCRGATVKRDSH